MTRGTHGSLEHRLGLLLEACDDDDDGTNAPGPPASDDQIAALQWIFACGTESRDALAFDPSSCSDAMLTYRAYWESWLYASDANPPAKPRPRPTPSPYFDPAA